MMLRWSVLVTCCLLGRPATNLFSCTTQQCAHSCTETEMGPACQCEPGWVASGPRDCLDRDECGDWGACSQVCTNTVGSHSCSCLPGFTARPGRPDRCQAAGEEAVLFFTAAAANRSGEEIRGLALRTGRQFVLTGGLAGLAGLATASLPLKTVYWAGTRPGGYQLRLNTISPLSVDCECCSV